MSPTVPKAVPGAPTPDAVATAAAAAARAIPPAWPLAANVAVNPFLGQSDQDLLAASARLARVAGAKVTMPRAWRGAQIAEGVIDDNALRAALERAPAELRPADLNDLKAALGTPSPEARALPTVADLAAGVSGIDWSGLIDERFGAFAAGYLDEGQALWAAPRGRGAYAAWRAVATHDLTPEIVGLQGFAALVSEAPEGAPDALKDAVDRLALTAPALPTYFHQLLTTLGGWSQFARYRLWEAELAGGEDAIVTDFLAIRLLWEVALFERYRDVIGARWAEVVEAHAQPLSPTADEVIDVVLQAAAENAAQRRLAHLIAATAPAAIEVRPLLQAAFCIDVRSEVFRRALESVNPAIQTVGFAGFFGLAAAHRRFASDVREKRFPVLLSGGLQTASGGPEDEAYDRTVRVKARAKRAWGRFKLAAVSSFAFVEATGPLYVGKLLSDATSLSAPRKATEPAPRLDPALDLEARTSAAASVLRAMSLTQTFARLVLVLGHGAEVKNNPLASGLQCGACGGYSGEVNARLLASLLNDPLVRRGLGEHGIEIPADTLFIAGLHDTTSDAVALYAGDHPSAAHESDLAQARAWLAAAGTLARGERALRLPGAGDGARLPSRGRDWAEVRPEWALAGCQAFIAAPRRRTLGKAFGGRVFLHDYDFTQDKGLNVLELILTAPVVVASWISLQYYGSTVAPAAFGGGNKLLHNVVGGVGVLEGNGGKMRAGLAWQSIHDGERFVHDPLRLSVFIEAPREAITEILSRHAGVRTLFDNHWLHLFALNDAGRAQWRYEGALQWRAFDAEQAPSAPVDIPA